MTELNNLVNRILNDCGYEKNPYFANLQLDKFSKDDFIETQIQFYFAVSFFSRPMAALVAKIPLPEQRVEIIRNIWEEHGEGHLTHTHGKTFLAFLDKLGGIDLDKINLRGLWPEVRIFNTSLAGATVLDDFMIGVGCMGIIERMFADISAWIGKSVVDNGWIRAEDMVHYKVHANLDIKHSQDFFDILEQPYSKGSQNQYHIEQGLQFGAHLFNGLYRGLWEQRKRRWLLNHPVLHSYSAEYNP